MANQIDIIDFEPTGAGSLRITVSASVASTPVGIPGSGDAAALGSKTMRVRLVNESAVCALVALSGQPTASAGMTILPGTSELFTLPYTTNGITLSAMGVSGQATICATAGKGS